MPNPRLVPQGPGVLRYADLAAAILAQPARHGRTRIVAVDGGSAAGKTTIATRLAAALDASLVHTDDVAWWESFFDWWPLLRDEVLGPLAAGRDVAYRPPAWQRRDRPGAIHASAGPAVVVEGVGAGRRELADHLDVVVWVDTDRQRAFERGLARPGEDLAFWREWELAEEEHFDRDRPWERADLLVTNDPPGPPDPDAEVVVIAAATWRRADRPVTPPGH